MSKKFYAMQAEIIASRIQREDKEPQAKTVFIVAAWYKGGYWRIHCKNKRKEFPSREAAEKFGSKLSVNWKYVQIIELNLPGQKAESL